MKVAQMETGIRAAIKFIEAFNTNSAEDIGKLLDENSVYENENMDENAKLLNSKKNIMEYWKSFFESFPGIHCDVEDAIGLGFRCILFWKQKWENPDKQEFSRRGIYIFLIKKDLIVLQQSYIKANQFIFV